MCSWLQINSIFHNEFPNEIKGGNYPTKIFLFAPQNFGLSSVNPLFSPDLYN
jgi:hypothetical protein